MNNTIKNIVRLFILSLILLNTNLALADETPDGSNEAATPATMESETETVSPSECRSICRQNYECGINIFSQDYKECRDKVKTCILISCGEGTSISENKGLQGEELINSLVPSQNTLFGNDENIKLTEGDLEQELAPRILKILVQFSSLLGFILFTYLGIRLVFARSNEEEFTNTKNALIHTFVGAVIIAASFGIVVAILQIFNSL